MGGILVHSFGGIRFAGSTLLNTPYGLRIVIPEVVVIEKNRLVKKKSRKSKSLFRKTRAPIRLKHKFTNTNKANL